MNLLQLLLGSFTSNDSVNSVSKKTGLSKKDINKLLWIALPLLISYLTKNASKKEGAQSLLGALGQHNSTSTVPQQIAGADSDDGAKIIAHILGKDQNTIVNTLAHNCNLTTAQVNSVLNNIAPALLSSLSTATNAQAIKPKPDKVDLSDGIDLSDIAALLGGNSVSNTNANPAAGLLGSLLGGNASQQQQTSGVESILGTLLGGNNQPKQSDGMELLGLLTQLMK